MSVHASFHVICRDDMSRVCFQEQDVNMILNRQTVIESLTLEREVRGSIPTSAVLCP